MIDRPPVLRASYDELIVDNFAGGGGASTGIEYALGRHVDIAINHSPQAIAMHRANHPQTKHFCENICDVDPREACGQRPVGLAWFSPDCTHFSRAKGTQPLKKEIRGLAWVVIRWATAVRPRIIVLENVEEFQTWGPLDANGRPLREGLGDTFRQWLATLQGLGYRVEFRSLVAADYGTPTTRRRFFLIARCDGHPIVWPEPTHGRATSQPWRAAADVIDWSLPVPSIFSRRRPLAEATLQRIAMGIQRYVLRAARPFIVPLTHQGSRALAHSIDAPLRTVTAAHRGELALVEPFVVRHGHYSTLTGAGLRDGCGAGTFRGQALHQPLATVCATNDKHIVYPFVTKHYGGVVGHSAAETLGTVTARDHHALSAALLTKYCGAEDAVGNEPARPGQGPGTSDDSGGHITQVRAFLLKYYGAEGRASVQQVLEPLHTITSKARFGLVMVHGEPYQIVDIGMRMLQPRELFRAQGFDDSYVIDPVFEGKPLTKTAQIALAGNSVCPQVAAAIVVSNVANAELKDVAS